jgi:hypothetical protein
MRRLTVCMFLLFGLLLGCALAPVYDIKVDSISGPDVSVKKRYVLISGMKDISADDLLFKEYALYVNRAMTSAGYTKSDDSEHADIAVYLSYGIGDPKDNVSSYSVPIWGLSSTSPSDALVGGPHPGITTYTPTYGFTGSMTYISTYTSFLRFIILDAVDLEQSAKSGKIVPVWKTTVTSLGSSWDLRRLFPILMAAARPYIGANTGHQVDVTLTEESKTVLEIKSLPK